MPTLTLLRIRARSFACAALTLSALAPGASDRDTPRASAQELAFGAAVAVSSTEPDAGQREPDVLALDDGRLAAVWVDDRLGAGRSLWSAILPSGAEAWGHELRVTSLDPDGTGQAAVQAPRLSVDGWSSLHVVWREVHRERESIWQAELRDGDAGWSMPERIDDGRDPVPREDPVMVGDVYGNLHAVWSEGALESDLAYRRRLPDGRWGPVSRLNEPADGVQRRPDLVAAPDGNLYAVWEDTREGRSDIAASRLPPGGDVWWPNAILNRGPGAAALEAPRLTLDSQGRPVAAWIERLGAGRIRTSYLPRPDAFWEPDAVRHEAALGRLVALDVAGAPGLRVSLAWTESRPDAGGDRLFAGAAPVEGLERASAARVDGGRSVSHAASPVAAIDAVGRIGAVWLAHLSGRGAQAVVSSRGRGPVAALERRAASGRLLYQGRAWACGIEAYALVDCGGQVTDLVDSQGRDLTPFLGAWVRVEGAVGLGASCRPVAAERLTLEDGPCPRRSTILTGRLMIGSRPADRAEVATGGQRSATGPSGRYAILAEAGRDRELTASAACALPVTVSGLELNAGLNPLGELSLAHGDLNDDCRIDMRDLVLVAGAQERRREHAHPECMDLDRDGWVSLFDLAPVAAMIGRGCRVPPSTLGALALETSDEGRPTEAAAVLRWVGPPAQAWQIDIDPALASRLGDLDPDAAGRQPFAAAAPGLVLVSQTVLTGGGRRWLVARLGPSSEAPDALDLGRLAVDRSTGAPTAIGVVAADADGRRVVGRITLGRAPGPAYLPRLGPP